MKKSRAYLTAFRYVVPADYEAWFESLALEGWHPVRIGQWSSICMRFAKGQPKKYRYVVDLQAAPKNSYRATYESFGWEYVGRMASVFVWRKEYTGERPEAFTDVETQNGQRKRFVKAIGFSFALFSLAALALVILYALQFARLTPSHHAQFLFGFALSSGFALYLYNVMRRIRRACGG